MASATRNGKRLIAVVLGASSGQARSIKAIQMLDRGFSSDTLSWLRPSLGTVDSLTPIDASPPDLRDEMCSGKRHSPASDEDEDTIASNATSDGSGQALAFFATGQTPALKPSECSRQRPRASEPIPVYTGPTRTGPALIAAVAADANEQAAAAASRERNRATRRKSPMPADDAGKAAKSKLARHANAKPDAAAKSADKPAATESRTNRPNRRRPPSLPSRAQVNSNG